MSSAGRAAPAALAWCALLLASSCASARALSDGERELAVWFIEDVAHGHPRRPAELALTAPSPTMRRLAYWLGGGTSGRYQQGGERTPEDYHPPPALAARIERWPALRALFVAHQVVTLRSGLVAARPDLSSDEAVEALPVVDHENLDRRALDALVVGLDGDAGGAGDQRAWLALSAATRRELDLQAGAEAWPPVAGGRPPVAGGRPPVVGDKPPVAGDKPPVARPQTGASSAP